LGYVPRGTYFDGEKSAGYVPRGTNAKNKQKKAVVSAVDNGLFLTT
jgi:hypothetical protein